MGHVFISYSHEDAVFVSSLTSSLRVRGIEYWRDIEHFQPGDVWDEKIHHALKNAERLIVILSENSVKHSGDEKKDEVGKEWRYALANNKPVIPVYLRTCEIPYRLNDLQYVDFRTNYQRGIDQLTKFLHEPVNVAQSQDIGTDPSPYIKMLKDENWHIRFDAVEVLIKMLAGAGTVKLAEVLRDVINDTRPIIHDLVNRKTTNFQVSLSPKSGPPGTIITLKSTLPLNNIKIAFISIHRPDIWVHTPDFTDYYDKDIKRTFVSEDNTEICYKIPAAATPFVVGLHIVGFYSDIPHEEFSVDFYYDY